MNRSANFVMLFESWRGAIVLAMSFAVCAAGAYLLDDAVIPGALYLAATALLARFAVYLYRTESKRGTGPPPASAKGPRDRTPSASITTPTVVPLRSAKRRVSRPYLRRFLSP
ncbi:MAG TPA: hypothetical protein VFG20_18285 [Planctomycetaceae bacterium]|jgi:hypothetical protein|nr:hypothetical protein [Planctomycetaceae bacterium]